MKLFNKYLISKITSIFKTNYSKEVTETPSDIKSIKAEPKVEIQQIKTPPPVKKTMAVTKVAKVLGYSHYVFKDKLTRGLLPDLKYSINRKPNSEKIQYIFYESDVEEYIKCHPITDKMLQVKVAAKALGYKTSRFRKLLKKGLVPGLNYSIVDKGGALEYIIYESDVKAYLANH